MDSEHEIINRLVTNLPRSPLHLNEFQESDAEIFYLDGKKLLISVDEFSKEDFFNDTDPYLLGWNLAACTLSDVFACGADPLLYAHSMSFPIHTWEASYQVSLCEGISSALNQCSTGFIGGDLGHATNWHYTGIILGQAEQPITRKGCKVGDAIFMTGTVGGGNIEPALQVLGDKITRKYLHQFPLRDKESKVIRNYATCCIDSSDGLLNALMTIADINRVGFKIDTIPYLKMGEEICRALTIPKELLCMGECGEYELVFTVNGSNEKAFLQELEQQKLAVTKIGTITETERTMGIHGKRWKDVSDFHLRARSYPEIQSYIEDLISYLKH
jgi:thiamine-monophosphate kinase